MDEESIGMVKRFYDGVEKVLVGVVVVAVGAILASMVALVLLWS